MKLLLAALFVVGASAKINWVEAYSNGGSNGRYRKPAMDVGSAKFNLMVKDGYKRMVKRTCADCDSDYKEIIYMRIGNDNVNYYNLFHKLWASSNNRLNRDFRLYSNDADALADRNRWNFCNYDDHRWQIGFPRDCGKSRGRSFQWNSLKHTGTRRHYQYYVASVQRQESMSGGCQIRAQEAGGKHVALPAVGDVSKAQCLATAGNSLRNKVPNGSVQVTYGADSFVTDRLALGRTGLRCLVKVESCHRNPTLDGMYRGNKAKANDGTFNGGWDVISVANQADCFTKVARASRGCSAVLARFESGALCANQNHDFCDGTKAKKDCSVDGSCPHGMSPRNPGTKCYGSGCANWERSPQTCKNFSCKYANRRTTIFGKLGADEKYSCIRTGVSGCECKCHSSFQCTLNHAGAQKHHCGRAATDKPVENCKITATHGCPSIPPKKLVGTYTYFNEGSAKNCEWRSHYLYEYRGSDCTWTSNIKQITTPHPYQQLYASFHMAEYGNLEDKDYLSIELKTCKLDKDRNCGDWKQTIKMQDDVLGWRWTAVNGGPRKGQFNGRSDWTNTPVSLQKDDAWVQIRVTLKSDHNYGERHIFDNLSIYGASYPFNKFVAVNKRQCLDKALEVRKMCYADTAAGHGTVSATWIPTGERKTDVHNNMCSITYSQGCPNQNQHLEQFQNHMEQGLSEAQCHKKADDYRSLCFTTQSHGSGSVTASYEVNGKSKSRAVSSWQNVCSIQVSSCPKQQRELGHVDALHKTHMAKSYVTVTVDGHTVTKTTKAYTHQKCAAAAAKVNDECFDASDQKSTFQQVYTGSQYRPFVADVGSAKFQQMVLNSPHKMVKRVCNDCHGDYKEIIYKRIRNFNNVNYYNLFHKVWVSHNNRLNRDFRLYSNYADALADRNRWNFCNYDDHRWQIGFPRDCGKSRGRSFQWNSRKHGGTRHNYAYFVEQKAGTVTYKWLI